MAQSEAASGSSRPGHETEGPTLERTRHSHGFNLLGLRAVRLVLLSPLFPYVVQAAILAIFIWLAIFGWGQFAPEGVPAKAVRPDQSGHAHHLGPVVAGHGLGGGALRPGVVRRLSAGTALQPHREARSQAGREAASPWPLAPLGLLIVGFYALIQMLIAGVELHRVPAYTSIFLWSLLALAAFTGFFLKDRAFCRGFCPVGLLLSTYGRGAMLAVRSCGEGPCGGCTDKDCRRPENRNRLDARSCPSLLNPVTLKSNTDCLVCLQCAKACPSSNMGLFLRRPFHVVGCATGDCLVAGDALPDRRFRLRGLRVVQRMESGPGTCFCGCRRRRRPCWA